jgi:hypothetical protein
MMPHKLKISLYVALGALALTTVVLYTSPATTQAMLDETAAAPESGSSNVNLDFGKNNKGSIQVFLKRTFLCLEFCFVLIA